MALLFRQAVTSSRSVPPVAAGLSLSLAMPAVRCSCERRALDLSTRHARAEQPRRRTRVSAEGDESIQFFFFHGNRRIDWLCQV